MKSLSLKNLKNLKEHGKVLKGNYGVTALRNPNGSIAYRFQKRIKAAEKEALSLVSLFERGLHPREYDRQ